MPIGRWFAVALWLTPLTPLAAQGVAATAPPAHAQAGGPDIVVQGAVDQPSHWKRAESAHVIVTSKGSDAELKRVTNNLERLYYLMSRVLRRADTPDDTIKLQVTLVDSTDFLHAMGLRNTRSEEGPYPAIFARQRYYDPREDGEILVVARTDQVVDLDTALASQKDLQDAPLTDEDAGAAPSSGAGDQPPVTRAWEAVLYSAFAQHFLLTYLPAAYPRWYVDGVGALFSTMTVRRDGTIDYAGAPDHLKAVFRSYGDLNVADVLTGHYLETAPARTHWTPYHAWLLAHYFLFSSLTPQRSQQFAHYMTAIHQGTPMTEAAKVFGDLRKLQREVTSDAFDEIHYARAEPPKTLGGDPLIDTLSRSSAALIEEKIELGARLAADPGTPSSAAMQWLATLHAKVAALPYNADAILVEAEADCRSVHYDACSDDADRVLAKAPNSARALAWKGAALTHLALAAPAADRPAKLAAARALLERAIKIDSESPIALIAYFQSFSGAGEPIPDQALLGLTKVIRDIPAAPAPRLYLAEALVRQGNAELARKVAYSVLYGAYDSPEKAAAQTLFASAPAETRKGG